MKQKRRAARTVTLAPRQTSWRIELDRFWTGSCGRLSRWLRKRTAVRFLFRALVDFDGTLEVRAIFNADARGRQVAIHRAVFLDFNPILGAQVALHAAVDHHLAGDNVCGQLRGGSDSEFPF